MKTIDVSTKSLPNRVAMVDDEDFQNLSRYRWYAKRVKATEYAYRKDESHRMISMHGEVLGGIDAGAMIDHRDHNGLNNQKDNLRIVSNRQNAMNMQKQSGKTSRYKGVSLEKRTGLFKAAIRAEGRHVWLGRFRIEEDAARAYNQAAEKYHGDFAWKNAV